MTKPSTTSVANSELEIQERNKYSSEPRGEGTTRGLATSSPRSTARWYLAGIVLFWALIYIPGLASPGMMDDADSEHAQIGREMLARHDFVTMHVNGVRYLDKRRFPTGLPRAATRFLACLNSPRVCRFHCLRWPRSLRFST
jgi:hypothetical protein